MTKLIVLLLFPISVLANEVHFYNKSDAAKSKDVSVVIVPEGATGKDTANALANQLQSILDKQGVDKIQVNIIQNAHFHMFRKTKNRKLSSTNRLSTRINYKSKESLFIYPEFSYSSLQATDTENKGSASASSKENLGLIAGFTRSLNSNTTMNFFASGSVQAYKSPQSGSLDGDSNLFLGAGAQIDWVMDSYFDVKGRIGLKQLPYLNSSGSQIKIDPVAHPFLGLGLTLKWMPVIGYDFRTGVNSEFLNNSVAGALKASSGVNFGVDISYHFKMSNLPFKAKLSYTTSSLESTNTEQTNTDLGLILGLHFPL